MSRRWILRFLMANRLSDSPAPSHTFAGWGWGCPRRLLVRLSSRSDVDGKGEEPVGKRESYEPGTFCWVDLATTDAEGAKAFYGDLFGWEFRDDEIPGGVYSDHGDAIGAIGQQDKHPPHWNNYVSVTSAEETAARAKRLGARILEEPFDVGGFGRLAVLADPAGAVLCVWERLSPIGAGRVNDVGCMGWNELQTSDSEAAGDFYSGLFDWETEPIEEGGSVVYTTIKNVGSQNGGFMPLSEQHGDAPSFWL